MVCAFLSIDKERLSIAAFYLSLRESRSGWDKLEAGGIGEKAGIFFYLFIAERSHHIKKPNKVQIRKKKEWYNGTRLAARYIQRNKTSRYYFL